MSMWTDFFHGLTHITPATGRLADSFSTEMHRDSGLSALQSMGIGAVIGTGAAAGGGAFGGSSGSSVAPMGGLAPGETGAFDMGGSAGVFDSQGMPLYHSPAAAGMTPYQKFAQLPHMNSGGGQQPQMIQTPIDQSMEQSYQQRLAQMMRGGDQLSTTTNFGYGPKLAQAMWA